MKKMLLALIFTIILISCNKSVIPSDLESKNGIMYEKNTTLKYTGKVTEYFRDGKVKSKKKYKNGRKNGNWILYEKNNKKLKLEFKEQEIFTTYQIKKIVNERISKNSKRLKFKGNIKF